MPSLGSDNLKAETSFSGPTGLVLTDSRAGKESAPQRGLSLANKLDTSAKFGGVTCVSRCHIVC